MGNIFKTFKSTLRGMFDRGTAPHSEPYQGRWAYQSVGNSIVAGHDSYDNVFPYVNAIANRFASVIPYAVNEGGERISTPPAVQALYAPNDSMSCREFFSYLAATLLVNSHTDILIWTANGPGGDITADNITGYTFLPSDARIYLANGDYYYQTQLDAGEGERLYTFSRDEVISLVYARHPSDISVGVAPAMTVTKWANVDDLLADYERGFFGNGTVPAGMIEIVAESPDDFTRTKQQIETRFRGAANHNSVIYNYRPADPITHETVGESKISWVPFSQSNDSLDLSTLNDVVNNRLANALAVPDIIRGIDNGQTYANAEQAQRTFIENTLQPLCLNVWDKWQFELDRITGGLGYGITFDLDLPAQTDVEKARADTTSVNVDNLLKLIDYGATVDDAVEALGLPEEYKRLRFNAQTEEDTTEDTKPVLVLQHDDYAVTLTNKVLNITRDILQAVWDAIEAGEYVDIQALADKWGNEVYGIMEDMVLKESHLVGRKLEESLEHEAKDNPLILPLIPEGGFAQWSTLPDAYRHSLESHLHSVAESSLRTAQSGMLDIKRTADDEDWTEKQTRDTVRHYINITRSRTLSKNEKHIVESLGGYYAASDVAEQTHMRVFKTWHSHLDDSTCAYCKHMDGTTVEVTQAFSRQGDTVTIDDTDYTNDYADMDVPNAHPNCRCWATYEVRAE